MRRTQIHTEGFPARIQHLAGLAGSITALATRTEIHRRTLTAWIAGTNDPHPSMVHKFAERLGVDLLWLKDGMGQSPKSLETLEEGVETAVGLTPIEDARHRSLLAIDAVWIKRHLASKASEIILYNMPDDSMEPTIGRNEPVICKMVPLGSSLPEPQPTNLYLFGDEVDGLKLRRARMTGDGDRCVMVPDNRNYPEEEAGDWGAHVLARAIWSGRLLDRLPAIRRSKG